MRKALLSATVISSALLLTSCAGITDEDRSGWNHYCEQYEANANLMVEMSDASAWDGRENLYKVGRLIGFLHSTPEFTDENFGGVHEMAEALSWLYTMRIEPGLNEGDYDTDSEENAAVMESLVRESKEFCNTDEAGREAIVNNYRDL